MKTAGRGELRPSQDTATRPNSCRLFALRNGNSCNPNPKPNPPTERDREEEGEGEGEEGNP